MFQVLHSANIKQDKSLSPIWGIVGNERVNPKELDEACLDPGHLGLALRGGTL